jgi:hypothetical protein
MAAAYKALSNYSDHGTTTLRSTDNQGRERLVVVHGELAFARPNKFHLSHGANPFELICDGAQILFIFPKMAEGQAYAHQPAPAKVTFESVASTQAGRKLKSLEDGSLHMRLLFDLLTAEDAAQSIVSGAKSLSIEPDREVDGRKHWSLLLDTGRGPDQRRLLIGPDTRLLRRIESVPRARAADESPLYARWDAGIIDTAPQPPETFLTMPPEGAREEIDLQP